MENQVNAGPSSKKAIGPDRGEKYQAMRSAIHFWLRRAQTERQKTLVSADSIFIDTAKQLRRIYYFARVSLDNVLRFFSFFFLFSRKFFPFLIPDCAKHPFHLRNERVTLNL